MANNDLRELIDLAGARTQSPAPSPLVAPFPTARPTDAATSAETSLSQSLVQAVIGPGSGATATDELTRELSELRRQLSELNDTGARQTESIERNTSATVENSSAQGHGGNAGLEFAKKEILGRTNSGGLMASPLVSGLRHLFSRGSGEEAAPIAQSVEPPPVRLEMAPPSGAGEEFTELRRGAGGLPERLPTPQVTIHVSAIDSRSFLDHSDAIAQAVREAMLNTHSLNDLMGDL